MSDPTTRESGFREPLTYARAGVDIDAKYSAVKMATAAIRETFTPGVLADIGAFGGLFDLKPSGWKDPVLVMSADGVGTKIKVAAMAGRYDTVGADLVNHCVNDILVQGAIPLCFLDYVGIGKMEPELVRDLIHGCARACKANGCALIGGETAEMPGVYPGAEFDLVGFIVGACEREHLVLGERVREGDCLLGLTSSGLHTNGYTLARKIVFERMGLRPEDQHPSLGRSIADALLAEHRSYLGVLLPWLKDPDLHAMSHITGGGIPDNLPRMLPAGCGARVRRKAWEIPALFRLLVEEGGIPEEDAYRTFNMGIGYVLVVAAESVERFRSGLQAQGEDVIDLGEIVAGPRVVRWA